MSVTHLERYRRAPRLRAVAASAVLAVLGWAEPVRAFSSWINASGGSYTTASNWSPANVPDSFTEGAFFNLNTAYTVVFPSNVSALLASVTDGNVIWDLGFVTPRTYTLGSLTVNRTASSIGVPILTVLRGTVSVQTIQVSGGGQLFATSTGTIDAADGGATVSGAGSIWTNDGQLVVGNTRTGTLTIEAGGGVSSKTASIGRISGATGTVTVTGGKSTWTNTGTLRVGSDGEGTLTIADGSSVTNTVGGSVINTLGVIGVGLNASGTVTVTGAGSTWTNDGQLVVGDDGTAVLRIEAGGIVSSDATAVIASGPSATGMVTVTGSKSTWTNTGTLRVGSGGEGTLTIAEGGSVTNALGVIGVSLNASGTVTVTGSGSSWINSDEVNVGFSGSGTLLIEDGAAVASTIGVIGPGDSASGIVTVTGEGSTWTNGGELHVGSRGDGTLRIEAGGSVENTAARIGRVFGSAGTVTVTGIGSTWTNSSNFHIGGQGEGTLRIEDGASVASDSTLIADTASSRGTVTVTGSGSTWTISSNRFGFASVSVGSSGTGMMTIEAGGSVSSNAGRIGRVSGSSGTVSVTGADSTWTNSDELEVGRRGTGTLMIRAGGSVSNAFGVIGQNAGSSGEVIVTGAGSTWTSTGQLSIGGDAVTGTNGGAGTLTVEPGGAVEVAQDVVLFPDGLVQLQGGILSSTAVSFEGGGQFDWTGGTLHVEIFDGNLVNAGGTLAPGNSTGSTTILGDYTQQAGAALEIEIGGTSPGGTHDLVSMTGNAILGGELQLVMLDGFAPGTGDTFTILHAADGIFGVFNNVTTGQRLDTVDGLGSFLVHYGPGSRFNQDQIVLTDFEGELLAGDCDGDRDVDLDDAARFPDCLGGPGVPLDPNGCDCVDLVGDGVVDLRDFSELQRRFRLP